jgi:hypothetical protein
LTAPASSSAQAGAWRQAASRALAALAAFTALALPCAAHAQFAATLGMASVNRYRGAGTDDVGPVVRASVMADSALGAYGGISGLWRTRDAGLASADAMVGWSGRLNDLPALAALPPGWGWDAALHRTHYGEDARYDFSEAMAGLLAPAGVLRTWFAPHYFGGTLHTLYTEFDASHAFDDRWRVFGHAGWLHYGHAAMYQSRVPDRVDTLAGIGATFSSWDFRLARDGIVAGHARTDIDARRRRAAWILEASVAF